MNAFEDLIEATEAPSGPAWLRDRRGAVVGVVLLVLLVSGSSWGWSQLRDGDGEAPRFDNAGAAPRAPGGGGGGGAVVPGEPLVLPPLELTQSPGVELDVLPAFEGMTLAEVRAVLSTAGLTLEALYGDKYPVCQDDDAAIANEGQEPASGTATEGLAEVRVYFSRTHADGRIAVPDVVAAERTEDEARADLELHKFAVDVPFPSTDGLGRVIEQTPVGCSLVPQGSVVELAVDGADAAASPTPTTEP